MLEVRALTSRVPSHRTSLGNLGSCLSCAGVHLSRGNDGRLALRLTSPLKPICHRSSLCSRAFAPSQQRLGIFNSQCPELAETAKAEQWFAAGNSFRMRTYKKTRVGGMCRLLAAKTGGIARPPAKRRKISSYASYTAKCRRICTCKKIKGWPPRGGLSP